MKKQIIFTFIASVWLFCGLLGKTYEVDTLEALNNAAAAAKPGDTLQLRSGEWVDFDFTFDANGREGLPITLTGAADGSTRLSGYTQIVFAGDFLQVQNLHLEKAEALLDESVMVSFEYGEDEYANDCRLTNVYFDHCNPSAETRRYHWVKVFGHRNRVDHCLFQGQAHSGVTIQVAVAVADAQHRIDHNHFLDRAVGEVANGFECIQFGQSYDSMKAGNSVVEYNLFERCDGETEIVSNKTCNNIYRGNLFLESRGTLTLRHGNDCVVEDNVFIGNGKKGASGVRVIGERHVVRHNYFSGLGGFTGGVIVFYTGIPDSPLNGYFAAHDLLFEANVMVNSTANTFSLNGGFGVRDRSILPKNIRVIGNVMHQINADNTHFSGYLEDLYLSDNIADIRNEIGRSSIEGISIERLEFETNSDGLLVPIFEDREVYVPQVLKKPDVGPDWTAASL